MKSQATIRGSKGFNRTELLVVIGVLVLMAAVALMFWCPCSPAYRKSSRIGCVNNLKETALCFKIWAGDNADKYPMQVSVTNGGAMELALTGDVVGIFRVMSNEMSTPKILVCPEDTSRHYATNFTTDFNNQTISYFVGLDADEKDPQMILSGDDNLEVNGVRVRPGIFNPLTNASVGWTKERHGGMGNIAFTDGSAQQSTVAIFKSTLVNTGVATNRLVIP